MSNVHETPLTKSDYSALTSEEICALLLEKENKIEDQEIKIKKLSSQLNWLTEQFKQLKSKHYAKSSEKQSVLQLGFFDENETELGTETQEDETEEITYTRKKKSNRPNTNIDTSQLPREKHYIDLSDDEKQCDCGQCMKPCGEQSKEELVFIPGVLKVIKHIRIKYACDDCDRLKMPQVVELPMLKSKASASLLSDIILNKYRYHLPFYRQSKMLKNHGIDIPDNTLAGWVMRSAEALEPLREAFWQQLATVTVLQADETPVKVLNPEKKGYMWLYHCYLPGKKFILFDFNLSRSSEVVNKRLKDFKGLLQTDGYSGYCTQRARPDVITLGCWDHCHRKFSDVVKAAGNNKEGKAGPVLEKIAKLYRIEQEIKDLPHDERKRIRRKKSKPKVDDIKNFVDKINTPPKSLLGIGVTYCHNQWSELIRYIDHGEAEISIVGSRTR